MDALAAAALAAVRGTEERKQSPSGSKRQREPGQQCSLGEVVGVAEITCV